MSTFWYGMRKPISSLRVIPAGAPSKRYDVNFWINHQRSGSFIVMERELIDLVDLFVNWDLPIVHQYYGGPVNKKITQWVGPLDYDGQVVSPSMMSTIVHPDDYNMERAEHLWLTLPDKKG